MSSIWRYLRGGMLTLTLFPPPLRLHLPSVKDAMTQDWRNVGKDLRTAMSKYEGPPP